MDRFGESTTLRYEADWEPVTAPLERLVADLKSVRHGGWIWIFCGEASPTVYNEPAFEDAVVEVCRNRDAVLRVNCGPVVVVDHHGRNGILRLRDRGFIRDVVHRPRRGRGAHFRVVQADDGLRLYTEAAHPPLIPTAHRRRANLSRAPREMVQELAHEAIKTFERTAENARALQQKPGARVPCDALIATEDGLRAVLRATTLRDTDFSELDATEILALPEASGALSLSVEDAHRVYREEWVLMEVTASDAEGNPARGHVVAHGKGRAAVSAALGRKEASQRPGGPFYIFKATGRYASGPEYERMMTEFLRSMPLPKGA